MSSLLCRHLYLQTDVGLWRQEIGGKLEVRRTVHKVDADKRLAVLALVAMETLTPGVCSRNNTLGAVKALMVVAGAGARKDHGRRKLAE